MKQYMDNIYGQTYDDIANVHLPDNRCFLYDSESLDFEIDEALNSVPSPKEQIIFHGKLFCDL